MLLEYVCWLVKLVGLLSFWLVGWLAIETNHQMMAMSTTDRRHPIVVGWLVGWLVD